MELENWQPVLESAAQVSAIEQHQAALAAMSDLFAVVVPTIAELSN